MGRAFKLSAAIVALVLGGLALWVWLSAGNDAELPLGYGGFD